MANHYIKPVTKLPVKAHFDETPFNRTGQIDFRNQSMEATLPEGYVILHQADGGPASIDDPEAMVFAALKFGDDAIGVPLYLPPPQTPEDLAIIKSGALRVGRIAESERKIDIPQLILKGDISPDKFLKHLILQTTGYSPFSGDRTATFKKHFPKGDIRYRTTYEAGRRDDDNLHVNNDHLHLAIFNGAKIPHNGYAKRDDAAFDLYCIIPGVYKKDLKEHMQEVVKNALDGARAMRHSKMSCKDPGVDDYIDEFMRNLAQDCKGGIDRFSVVKSRVKDEIVIDAHYTGTDEQPHTLSRRCHIEGLRDNPHTTDMIVSRVREVLAGHKVVKTVLNSARPQRSGKISCTDPNVDDYIDEFMKNLAEDCKGGIHDFSVVRSYVNDEVVVEAYYTGTDDQPHTLARRCHIEGLRANSHIADMIISRAREVLAPLSDRVPEVRGPSAGSSIGDGVKKPWATIPSTPLAAGNIRARLALDNDNPVLALLSHAGDEYPTRVDELLYHLDCDSSMGIKSYKIAKSHIRDEISVTLTSMDDDVGLKQRSSAVAHLRKDAGLANALDSVIRELLDGRKRSNPRITSFSDEACPGN